MFSSQRLADKKVLVTGAGTGIGRGIASECAREGATIAVHYSHSADGAHETVAAIEAAGGKAAAFQADLRDLDAVKTMAGQAVKYFGGLDVLVNNAGITMNNPFAEVTPEQFDTVYGVNIRGMFFMTQFVLPQLEASKGAVVNITSIHAFQAKPEHTVYAATKGAIVAYTRTLAIELALKGIRVNAIAPGCVPVDNYTKAIGSSDLDTVAMGRNIPSGYVGTPEDIGRAVVFLASDDGKFIIGQTLVVDGGTSSWMAFNEQFRESMTEAGVTFGRGYVTGLQ